MANLTLEQALRISLQATKDYINNSIPSFDLATDEDIDAIISNIDTDQIDGDD